jgi:hypothetical protein
MALTEFERMVLRHAEEIKAREAQASGRSLSTPDGDRDYDAEIAFYEQYGTMQQVEQVRAAKEGRDPEWQQPNPVGSFGALVPPSEVRDAVTHQPLAPVVQPTQSDVDGDPSMPVREGDEEVAPYDEWTKPDLLEEARVRELPATTGTNKPELVDMLREDDAQHRSMRQPQAVEGDDTPPS